MYVLVTKILIHGISLEQIFDIVIIGIQSWDSSRFILSSWVTWYIQIDIVP